MNETIWVCTEDHAIFPTREDAWTDFQNYIHFNDVDDFLSAGEENLFNLWYRPMTFKEYDELYAW